jgi:DNA (cytosine-5)-methyltransferase 1
MSSRPTAVGIHIYSGAWTCGLMDRFEILGQWEELDAGADTFRLNFGGRIPHVVSPEGPSGWPVREHRGRVNLVYANPPCAVWSMLGSRRGRADPRLRLTLDCARTAMELEPDFFIMESVCRAWSSVDGRRTYEELALEFGRLGYSSTVFMTNALLYGVPQSRERFHFIAHRYEIDLTPPALEVRTVGDALAGLEDSSVPVGQGGPPGLPNHEHPTLGEPEMNVIRRIAPGEPWSLGVRRCEAAGVAARKARMIAGRLHPAAPARTVVDVSALVHPTRDRLVTIREAARLCGYPDWFRFAPHPRARLYGVRAADVTQAVMPPVGEFLGRAVARALDVAEPPAIGPARDPSEIRVIDHRWIAQPFTPSRMLRRIAG